MENKWTPFYFEGNLAWGLIETPEDWERVKFYYKDNFDPSVARLGLFQGSRPYISFGLYSEYTGETTLAMWAEENGMKL